MGCTHEQGVAGDAVDQLGLGHLGGGGADGEGCVGAHGVVLLVNELSILDRSWDTYGLNG